MPKYPLLLSFLLVFATGCERGEEDEMTEQTPVAFTARTGGEEATRAGVIDDSNLTSMGVFASYTGQGDWSESSSKPDFMYNQPVGKSGGSWTYSPVKYWPNAAGDKISFFAYAPHKDNVKGLAISGYSNSLSGYPSFQYEPPVDATQQTDLLFASPLMNKTKGSNLAFTMGHVLTHVLFKVKSTSAITVTRVQVNSGAHLGYIKFNSGGYSWTSFSNNQTFYRTPAVSVAANTLTDVGDFFLLPRNAASVSLTFSEGGIEQPVTTVALPASPIWEMNKTIAYTLNIENKTKITLSVKSWDTPDTMNGNLGEEVPTTGYPFKMNGIVYESATKAYYFGPEYYYDYLGDGWGQSSAGWFKWDPAIRICRGKHSTNVYGAAEWRLPNIDELALGRSLGIVGGSSYWSITDNSSNYPGCAWALSGGGRKGDTNKESGLRLLCIRDVGSDLTYPTVRSTDDGFRVLHRSVTQSIMVQNGMSAFLSQASAKTYCSSLLEGGYGEWRLPTRDEATDMANTGIYTGSSFWIDATTNAVIQGNYQSVKFVNSALDGNNGHTRCVRNY